jgi:caa(3)-type oxidase subunit IV
MTAESHHTNYVTIWYWLIGLLAIGLVAAYLPMGKTLAIVVIFVTAAVKAFLVTRHYMHMKTETLLIYLIAIIPVVLLIGFGLALIPDMVTNR